MLWSLVSLRKCDPAPLLRARSEYTYAELLHIARRLELEIAGDGGILDDHNNAVLHDEALLLSLGLHHLVLVDELDICADAGVLVNNALTKVPASATASKHTALARIGQCGSRYAHVLSGNMHKQQLDERAHEFAPTPIGKQCAASSQSSGRS